MENRVLEVFYGADGKPYKDQERSVLFPVVGNEYQGANDFTHIRFYYQRLCGEDNTLVAVFKNAKGELGCRPLSTSTDSTRNEKYALLPISDFLTKYKGDIYIALQCYRGDANGVVWDDEQDIWVINEEVPTIRSTANIKMSVNYAPLIVGGGEEELLTLQVLLSRIAKKSDIDDVVLVVGDISQEDLSGYDVGQLFYDNDTHTYYEKTATSPYYTKALSGMGVLGAPNIICRSDDSTRTIAQLHTIYGDSAYIVLRYLGKDYLYFSKKTSSTYTCVAFDTEEQRFYKASGVSGGSLPSAMLIPANKIEIASKAFLVNNYVPYNGANDNLDLGEHHIYAQEVHLPRSKIYTDIVDDDATLLDGKFFYDNDYTNEKEDERSISSVKYVLENHLQLAGNLSGTFTNDEYDYVSKPNAVIVSKDGIKTYRFVKDKDGFLYFACFDNYIDTQADGSTISFGWLLKVKKSAKEYEEEEIAISVYPKYQAKDKFATNFTASLDNTTYVLTFTLKNANGVALATQTIDLPLESIVTSMTYYDEYTYGGTTYHNVLVIVLATTSVPTIVPVGSLISGLEHEALVEVSDISTPLTASQLALMEYPNAMIKYGYNVYLKAEDNGTYITLSVPYISLTTNSGHEEATRKFIVVTKSSGAMALTSDTTSFYNKSQADTLLSAKQDKSTAVSDDDIETLGGAVNRIRKGNTWNEVAQEVNMSATPKVVQSVADLPADNDGYLYVVLDNGYLYSWDEANQEWAQQYQYTSDLFTITEVEVGDYDYSYIADKTNGDRPIQVESAKKDGNGDVIDETYAKIRDLENGLIEPEVSKTAKNLLPVSQSSGSTQTAPFINQGTATNNNDSQAQVDTGTLGQHLEKQGNTICVNQLRNNYYSRTVAGLTIADNNNNTVTISGTADATDNYTFVQLLSIPTNHKYLILSNYPYQLQYSHGGGSANFTKCAIANVSVWANLYVNFPTIATTVYSETFRVDVIDLTLMFNGDIPQDLLDHPDNFYHYYNGSLDYNLGTLVNSNGRYLVNGNQNAWDEEWEVGVLVGGTINSKNYISVIPNTTYFLKSPYACGVVFYDSGKQEIRRGVVSANNTFTTPSNCCYIKFYCSVDYGTTYNHDITISLYYAGEDYSQYIPYKAPAVYDTGDEELKQAGRVKDYKEPNGTIHHLVGMVDLGTLTWTRYGEHSFYATINGIKLSNNVINYICSRYASRQPSYANDDYDKLVYGNAYTLTEIIITDSAYSSSADFKTAMSGVYLYFELATPTTEQGTPFTENMDINDLGNMAWYSAYTNENTNTLVSVPQGCKIFYPAWYVGFVDTLGQREDIEWSADEIVSQDQLGEVDDKHDNLYAIVNQNLGGILRHQLAEARNIDFNNTAWVDLGSLNWSYDDTNMYFNANVTDIKPAGSNTTKANILCAIYKTDTWNNTAPSGSGVNGNISVNGTSQMIGVRNTNYTSSASFKNAMKGILLAYEKASQ